MYWWWIWNFKGYEKRSWQLINGLLATKWNIWAWKYMKAPDFIGMENLLLQHIKLASKCLSLPSRTEQAKHTIWNYMLGGLKEMLDKGFRRWLLSILFKPVKNSENLKLFCLSLLYRQKKFFTLKFARAHSTLHQNNISLFQKLISSVQEQTLSKLCQKSCCNDPPPNHMCLKWGTSYNALIIWICMLRYFSFLVIRFCMHARFD